MYLVVFVGGSVDRMSQIYWHVNVMLCLRWMRRPRCGVPDHPHTSRRQRNKRYALTGQKWRDKKISYRYLSVHPSSISLTLSSPDLCNCYSLSLAILLFPPLSLSCSFPHPFSLFIHFSLIFFFLPPPPPLPPFPPWLFVSFPLSLSRSELSEA